MSNALLKNSMHRTSRRAFLASSLTVSVAVSVNLPAAAAACEISELIVDYRWAEEAACAADEAAHKARLQANIPRPYVLFGKRRITDPETGEVSWGQWRFEDDWQVEQHFEAAKQMWPNSAAHTLCADLLAELDRQWAAYSEAERAAGITALDDMCDQAFDALYAARRAVLAYQPKTLDEMATKNAFLLILARQHVFTLEEMEIVFSA